jgi:hypothetical protein
MPGNSCTAWADVVEVFTSGVTPKAREKRYRLQYGKWKKARVGRNQLSAFSYQLSQSWAPPEAKTTDGSESPRELTAES